MLLPESNWRGRGLRGTLVLAVNCVFVFVFGVSNAARSLDIVIKDDDFRETVLIGNVCWKSVWREGGRGGSRLECQQAK